MPQNLKAFIDTIAWGEGTSRIPTSDDGYDVLVGSTPQHPLLFPTYISHPRVYNRALNSTAAGRYQIIYSTWLGLCRIMAVNDFYPITQDAMAVQLIKGRGAFEAVMAGQFSDAVALCAPEWASLPGNEARQHQNTIETLTGVYLASGGVLAQPLEETC